MIADRSTTKEWLEALREIGQRMSVPDDLARSKYAQRLFNAIVPPGVEAIKRKFGLDPKLGQEANVARVREQAEASRLKGMLLEWQFAEDWARSGFAQVIVEPRLFASLCETHIPQELLPDIGVPWDCFVVRIPDEFHPDPVPWGDGAIVLPPAYMTCWRMPEEATYLVGTNAEVVQGEPSGNRFQFALHPAGAPGCSSVVVFRHLPELLSPEMTTNSWDGGSWVDEGTELRAGDLLTRQTTLLRQLFAGVVLELMSRPESRGHARLLGDSSGRRRAGKPKSFSFILTRPVVVDCRERVRAAMSGTGMSRKSAFVQRLIAGHWKHQPCGPGGTERKFIHIEPYWRGPEDAPIAVRPHILTGHPPEDSHA